MTDGSVAAAGEQGPNVYRECFDMAVEAVRGNFETFANLGSNQRDLLVSVATGYLILGETTTVEAIEEHPLFQEDPSARFDLYTALANEGAKSRLPKARIAGAVANEHATFLEDAIPIGDPGPLRQA